MMHLGRFVAACAASPAHHCSVGRQLAVEHLVPADDMTAMGLNKLFHTRHHITLEIVLSRMFFVAFDAEFLNLCLAFRTFTPAVARHLVATYMDVFAREDVHHLKQNILEKPHGVFVSGANHVFRDAPLLPYFVRTASAAKFRI